jgi:integrase
MTAIQHVFKRGSVYWWRRRLPNGAGACDWVRLEVSLCTKELELARKIAPGVTLASHRLQPALKSKMISADDARRILIQTAREHSEYLDSIMPVYWADRDAETGRRSETCTGWAMRLYAAQGERAVVGSIEERELRAAGLDDGMIEQVRNTLLFYKTSDFGRPGRHKLENILKQHGISLHDVHFKQAEALYMRGMAAALLNTERRWSGVRGDDLAVVQAALAAPSGPEPRIVEAGSQSVPAWIPREAPVSAAMITMVSGYETPISQPDLIERSHGSPEEQDDLDLEGEQEAAEHQTEPTPGLVAIVAQAAMEKIKIGEWRDGMDRQHIGVAKLFVRFVGHDQPSRMRQTDISRFRTLLFQLPKNHGKSPKDHTLPIAALVARAKDLPPEEVGLSSATLNRYMTQLNNIVNICKHTGYPFSDYQGVSGLRARKKGNVRNERGRFTTNELKLLFKLSIWNGSQGMEKRLDVGDAVFHDATYWLPLMSIYNAARREENCGLLLSEIDDEGEVPCFQFEDNLVRRLKNDQSKRRVPIHPELIRLGFLDYVGALRAAGHTLLFPELRSACADTPMGDVFDDRWQKMREAALPNAKEEGKVLHSLRHWCNNEMKQAGIHAEIRRDILGHSNGDVNEGRYTDSARLLVMSAALTVLPLPTADLLPHPVRLLDQVVTHTWRRRRASRRTVAA